MPLFAYTLTYWLEPVLLKHSVVEEGAEDDTDAHGCQDDRSVEEVGGDEEEECFDPRIIVALDDLTQVAVELGKLLELRASRPGSVKCV